MRVTFVVAVSRNGVIGRDNALPWHLPEDLRRFKHLTTGKPVIMGRKTFESIGRPLPNRLNIVISRGSAFRPPGVEVVADLDAALARARDAGMGDEAIIAGGGQIYALALPVADRIHLTEVDLDIDGHTFFPRLDPTEWREVSCERHDGNPSFSFVTLDRVG